MFRERLSLRQLLGGAAILAGVAMTILD
jgi:drug/metabolite transporter (DMT)-like permease